MTQTSMCFRVDEDLKQEFSDVCNHLGLNMSTALTIFMKAMVRNGGFPFDLRLTSAESSGEHDRQSQKEFSEFERMSSELGLR